jgi:hypothetical protein
MFWLAPFGNMSLPTWCDAILWAGPQRWPQLLQGELVTLGQAFNGDVPGLGMHVIQQLRVCHWQGVGGPLPEDPDRPADNVEDIADIRQRCSDWRLAVAAAAAALRKGL